MAITFPSIIPLTMRTTSTTAAAAASARFASSWSRIVFFPSTTTTSTAAAHPRRSSLLHHSTRATTRTTPFVARSSFSSSVSFPSAPAGSFQNAAQRPSRFSTVASSYASDVSSLESTSPFADNDTNVKESYNHTNVDKHTNSTSENAATAATASSVDSQPQPKQSSSSSSSSAARSQRTKRKIATKDPIVVTDAAASRIRELLAGESAKGAVGFRLGVKRRGCNGLSYTLNYAYPDDVAAAQSGKPHSCVLMTTGQGVTVLIEPMALFSVVGTTMDWVESELTSEFTFHNPNSKGECGCGESFTV